jgi:hypothetical protein
MFSVYKTLNTLDIERKLLVPINNFKT